jgi:hypothetical protein
VSKKNNFLTERPSDFIQKSRFSTDRAIALLYPGMYNDILRNVRKGNWRLPAMASKKYISLVILIALPYSALIAQTLRESTGKEVKKLIFDERRIEGKIRRPQLVLIKAEQRPEFEPMVLQSLGKTGNIVGSVEKKILEQSPYDGAFQFRDKNITNYTP